VVDAYIRALGEPAPVSIRMNPLKVGESSAAFVGGDAATLVANAANTDGAQVATSAPLSGDSSIEQAEDSLPFAELFDGPIPWEPAARYLRERPSFTGDPLFHAGAYYVQEASSMLVGHAARQLMVLLLAENTTDGKAVHSTAEGNQENATATSFDKKSRSANAGNTHLRVLDLCAAPGGKSTHLASVLGAQHLLVANEIVRSRAQILTENIIKWGQANVIVTGNDPAHFRTLGAWFDLILVDAPCSGEGLFRRDADAESHWSEEAITHCAVRQNQILNDIWPALKPGGFLIYSTCTFNRTENDISLQKLLESGDAVPADIDISSNMGVILDKITVNDISLPIYRCFPGIVRGEGFTFSVLQKRADVVSDYGTSRGKGRHKKASGHPHLDKLHESDNFSVWQSDKQSFALPRTFDRDFAILDDGLYIHHAGVGLGDAQRPDHSLALNTRLAPGAFDELALTREQALDYLRRESIAIPGDMHGLVRLTYAGLGLGFGKAVRGRLNNHYPQEWRIRMR
jgi:16S rRNA (cytosine1407-C5)-methyltransferase